MNAIAKVSYTHDAMIDILIQQPAIKQADLARHFGYTQAWVSRVMSSDAFRERLYARRSELVDPGILVTIEQNFEALARQSYAVLSEALEAKPSSEVALRALDLSARALGYGARKDGVTVNQTYVAIMPQKAIDARSWQAEHAPIDVSPSGQ